MEYLSENEFLINLAIKRFNEQHHKNLNPNGFNIRSIEARNYHKIGYEITSNIETDFLIIRIYLNIGSVDKLSNYSLDVLPNTTIKGELGDEVYVAHGTIDRYYLENNIYSFGIIENFVSSNSITTEDGNAIITEEGDYIIY